MRMFCSLCDTIDDQRSSTRRLHDVDTCANDLRLEMALLRQCGKSVLVHVKQRTTENSMRIKLCSDKHITLTTQVWIERPVSCKLMPETDFLKVKVPDTVSHNEEICSPLRSPPQSVEREYQRSAPVFQVSRYILQKPYPATVASSVNTSEPHCNSHGFTPWIRSTLNEGFSCLLQKVIKQSDSPCLSDQRVACVNSLISLVRSRRARSHDNVSV